MIGIFDCIWVATLQELSRIVEAAGGVDLPFNAITALAGSKALLHIAENEGLALGQQQAKLMMENSGGDLLNAMETLQLYGQGKQRNATNVGKKRGKVGNPGPHCQLACRMGM